MIEAKTAHFIYCPAQDFDKGKVLTHCVFINCMAQNFDKGLGICKKYKFTKLDSCCLNSWLLSNAQGKY